jgi:cyclic pyranopterin phosphate synthase
MVVRRGLNEDSVLPMARFAREHGYILRFIEYMDVGHTNGWQLEEVVPSADVVAAVDAVLPLEPIAPLYEGEVASRYRYRDGSGEIGVISSVTRPFCGSCTRARLTADGQLYTCLFGVDGVDLRAVIRGEGGEAAVRDVLERAWTGRGDRYSELRSAATRELPKVEMSRIGG